MFQYFCCYHVVDLSIGCSICFLIVINTTLFIHIFLFRFIVFLLFTYSPGQLVYVQMNYFDLSISCIWFRMYSLFPSFAVSAFPSNPILAKI